MRPGNSIHGSATNRDAGGFSLLEMLVSLAVILILITIMTSPSSKKVQLQRMAQCGKNLQNLHLVLKMYATDHGGHLPRVSEAETSDQPLSILVPGYSSLTRIFICPGIKEKPLPEAEPFAGRRISYAYYQGLHIGQPSRSPLLTDEQLDTKETSAGSQMFSKTGEGIGSNHHSFGGNILFTDGHIEQAEAEAARDFKHAQGVRLLNPIPIK